MHEFIEPVCKDLKLGFTRADLIPQPGRISTQLVQLLNSSDLVVADLTGLNPNVMYELGVRDGINKPTVLMTLQGTELPFDLHDLRTIEFDFELDQVDCIRLELAAQIKNGLRTGIGSSIHATLNPKTTHNGVKIEGLWQVDLNHERDIKMELFRCGTTLTGYSVHTKILSDVPGDHKRKYALTGQIRDGMVSLQGVLLNVHGIGMITFLVEITNDGDTMRGWFTAYSGSEERIIGLPCTIRRQYNKVMPK